MDKDSLYMPKASHFSLVAVLGALVASQVYQYSEIQSLKPSTSSIQTLSEHDVLALVDDRLDVVESRRARDQFQEQVALFDLAPSSTPDDRLIYGDLQARITLQEFADIECPYCIKMHPGLKQIVDSSDGQVNWEFKHFPLNSHNPVAALQAKAVECIKESYGNQVAWAALDQFMARTGGNGKGIGDIPAFARSLGLSGAAVDMCMASDAHENRVESDFQEGQRLGLTGTPALRIVDHRTGKEFVVKGYLSPEQIAEALQHLLRS